MADTCAEVPTPGIVTYNIERLRRIGYLPRFDGYLRQLGFSSAERASVDSMRNRELAAMVDRVADREPWGRVPDRHLQLSQCLLAVCPLSTGESALGLIPPAPAPVLEFYASLPSDVRLLVGVDPGLPGTLDQALALRDHPAFGGLALNPMLAGVSIDDPGFAPALQAAERHGLVVSVHSSSHFRRDLAHDINHPAHADTVLRRHPSLRLLLGHAGWPFVSEYCAVAARFPNVAFELSTFPPRLVEDPGWSLKPLLSRARELEGRVFFGSGQVSCPAVFLERLAQIDALPLGDQHDAWRGAGFIRWMEAQSLPAEPAPKPRKAET